MEEREGDACAVVIPPDGGTCKCFDAYIRGVDWMVTPQTRLQAGPLQTFNAGVTPKKGGDKGSPISKKKTPPILLPGGGAFQNQGCNKNGWPVTPYFGPPKRLTP